MLQSLQPQRIHLAGRQSPSIIPMVRCITMRHTSTTCLRDRFTPLSEELLTVTLIHHACLDPLPNTLHSVTPRRHSHVDHSSADHAIPTCRWFMAHSRYSFYINMVISGRSTCVRRFARLGTSVPQDAWSSNRSSKYSSCMLSSSALVVVWYHLGLSHIFLLSPRHDHIFFVCLVCLCLFPIRGLRITAAHKPIYAVHAIFLSFFLLYSPRTLSQGIRTPKKRIRLLACYRHPCSIYSFICRTFF
jgi:hypothetical protein